MSPGLAAAGKPLVPSPFPPSSPDEADPAGSPGAAIEGMEAELRAYGHAVMATLTMWRMPLREELAWHLEQARVAREWRDLFAKEIAEIKERLALPTRPTYERYDLEDTKEQRHEKDAAECWQLKALV